MHATYDAEDDAGDEEDKGGDGEAAEVGPLHKGPPEYEGIEHDGPACGDEEADGEEDDHGASEFVADGVPAHGDPREQEDDGGDVESLV